MISKLCEVVPETMILRNDLGEKFPISQGRWELGDTIILPTSELVVVTSGDYWTAEITFPAFGLKKGTHRA